MLDSTILYIMLAIGNIGVALFFLIYLFAYKNKNPYLIIHIVSRVCISLAFFHYGSYHNINDIYTFLVGHVFLIISISYDVFCLLMANTTFTWEKFKRLNYCIFVLIAIITISTLFPKNEMLPQMFTSFCVAFIYFSATLYTYFQKNASYLQRSCIFVYMLTSGIAFFRGFNIMFSDLTREWISADAFLTGNLLSFSALIMTFLLLEVSKERTEKEIELRNLSLIELNNSKDLFFSLIANDLRNPLSNLSKIGEKLLLQKGYMPNEIDEELIENLYESSKSTFYLVDNLLQWAMSDSGIMETNIETFKLSKIIEENDALFNQIALSKDIHIDNKIDHSTKVNADYNMINTVIRNLVANALKFTPNGGEIIMSASPTDNDMVEISVQDSGGGIKDSHLKSLFDLKTKNFKNYVHKDTGTGLGLILSKEFINRNGGNLQVSSAFGRGSTFKFTIPNSENNKLA